MMIHPMAEQYAKNEREAYAAGARLLARVLRNSDY